MTCIVALAHDDKVYMGADSASSNYYVIDISKQKKIFNNGGFLIGVCGSSRLSNVLKHSLTPPKRWPDVDLMKYMVTDFIDAVRASVKSAGAMETDQGKDHIAGSFIVGNSGRIFTVQGDLSVLESELPFSSVGSGEAYALGSFHTSSKMPPDERVELALQAAACFSPSVSAPFYRETI